MNLVHLHLLLNHVPVIGVFIGALLLAAAALRRNSEVAKAALGLLAFVGTIAIVVFFTGEPAQVAIEKLPGISERVIDRHEDAAQIATILTASIGALALGVLVFYRHRVLPRSVTLVALLGALGSSTMMGYTANLGGQIRHPEIGGGATSGAPTGHSDEVEGR